MSIGYCLILSHLWTVNSISLLHFFSQSFFRYYGYFSSSSILSPILSLILSSSLFLFLLFSILPSLVLSFAVSTLSPIADSVFVLILSFSPFLFWVADRKGRIPIHLYGTTECPSHSTQVSSPLPSPAKASEFQPPCPLPKGRGYR